MSFAFNPKANGSVPSWGMVARLCVSCLAFALCHSVALLAYAACESDNDCKGDRICEAGVCKAPPPAVDPDGPVEGEVGAAPTTQPAAPAAEPASAPPGYAPPPPPGYGPPTDYQRPPDYGYGLPPGTPVGPREMDYEDTQPIPPGYHVETKIRKGLVIGGAVTFGATYLFSVLAATVAVEVEEIDESSRTAFGTTTDTDGISVSDVSMLYIPVAGPFISISTYKAEGVGIAVLAIDGIAQAGGLAMLITGLTARKKVLRRGAHDVHVVPMVGGTRHGLALAGHF